MGATSRLQTTFWSAFLAVVSAQCLAAGEKTRNWQMGKVLDSERARHFAGTIGSGSSTGSSQTYGTYGTYQGSSNTSQTAMYRVYETFLIEGETHVYVAQQRLRWRWSKPANLTVNGPVKFAVEKRRLYVVDDDGKQHEMGIIKQVLKPTPPRNP
jgi:hypothetical protein